MRRIGQAGVVVVLLLAAIVVPTTAAQACSCAMGTPQQLENWAGAVFTGEIVDRTGARMVKSGQAYAPGSFTYTIEVDRVFKGSVTEVQKVVAGTDGAACGVVFPKEGPILVYGQTGKGLLTGEVAPDEYWTGLCSGSKTTSTAPTSYGAGAPPPTSAGYLSTATQTDPEVDTSSSALPGGVVVVGGAAAGALALIVGLVYLARRRRST
jgi:hypothetical protein